MKFPDFIIIGAMKCGTTVLWHNLNKHPEIFMGKNPEDPKKASTEIRFWNNGQPHYTFNKGINWYKNLFEGKCCGEKCANYIEVKPTMQRMALFIPDIKLILCIRNPVDRAYSEYQMQKTRLNEEFSTLLANKMGYIERGMYYKQIQDHILPFFSKKNLFIIVQERMKANPNKEMNRLYEFLGVNKYDLETKEITAKEATDRNLDLEKDGKLQFYKRWSSKYEPLSQEIRKFLTFYFKPHNEVLFHFLGEEIEEWDQ